MPRYFDRYDEMGEPHTILSGPRLKRALELSLEREAPPAMEMDRFRREAEACIERENGCLLGDGTPHPRRSGQ